MIANRKASRGYRCALLSTLLLFCGCETKQDPSSAARAPFSLQRIDKVDVLFMIDNSNSMAQEQASLSAQFPRLIEKLTRGERYPGDPSPFTPISDLHIGVVSSDMGIPGYDFGSCNANGGDDGRLQHTAHPGAGRTCDAAYPPFLSYQDGVPNPEKLAQDFTCVALLGTGGCGFEEQLEAPLKALVTATYHDASGDLGPNPTEFLAAPQGDPLGRGDTSNLGFLRDDSLLMIVVVTDEDDCSVRSTEHLRKPQDLLSGSPYKVEDINLRCPLNPDLDYDVLTRYYDGFRSLRPGHEDRVMFAAIAGVPVDLVDAAALAAVDFSDPSARDSFYDRVLGDPRMQIAVDPDSEPGNGNGNIKPVCARGVPEETGLATAYPAQRIATLAKAFGDNGMLQSICQDDFAPAIDAFVGVMAKPLGEMCLAEQLPRADDGTVQCKMFWTLPAAGSGAPTQCSELGPLLASAAPTSTDPAGRERCEIRQLPVHDGSVETGEGWYYDDFTPGLEHMCTGGLSRRIAFSAEAKPPEGAAVRVECNGAH